MRIRVFQSLILASLMVGSLAFADGSDPLSGQENANVQEIPTLTQLTFTQAIPIPANAASVPLFTVANLTCQLDMAASDEARVIEPGRSFVLGAESTADISGSCEVPTDETTATLFDSAAALQDSDGPAVTLDCTYPYADGLPTVADVNSALASVGVTMVIPAPVAF